MGVYIHLYYDPRGLEADAWASAYDETLAMLEAWPGRLLGWGTRELYGRRMPMYTLSIRDVEGESARWSVVGDRESLQCAECQTVSRAVGRRSAERVRSREAPTDILHIAAKAGEREGVLCRAFGNKTQGLPYHYAVLAAGMVFEERFPRRAFVSGDIDRDDAEIARRMAAPILGRELLLPVSVDAPRLVERMRDGLDDRALDAALVHLFRGHRSELLEAQVRARPGHEGERWWREALARVDTDAGYDDLQLLVAWLNAGRSVADAARLACVDPRGPRRAPAAFVKVLADSWLAIPIEARALRSPSTHGTSDRAITMSLWMLGNAFGGRHLRLYVPFDRVAADLCVALGDDSYVAMLRENTDEALCDLRKMSDGVASFAGRFARDRDEEFDRLATLRSLEAMSEDARRVVHCLAWNVGRAQRTLRERDFRAVGLDDATGLKRLIVERLYGHTPTLTEDAWDTLLALDDPGELAWVLALASLVADETHLSRTRRALLENPMLRAYAMAAGRDDDAMAEIAAEVERSKAERPHR